MIAIVDYDMGNVASIANMLKRVGQSDSVITRDPDVLLKADKVIIPGVGGFERGMRKLTEFGLVDALHDAVMRRGIPALGICLGMQLLTRSSEEGNLPGLGWIDAETKRFQFTNSELKVPHMGWNYVAAHRANPLIQPTERSRFYFVHGYYVQCSDDANIVATTRYGTEFASAISRQNVYGVQFHPEKSHRYGVALLDRFARL